MLRALLTLPNLLIAEKTQNLKRNTLQTCVYSEFCVNVFNIFLNNIYSVNIFLRYNCAYATNVVDRHLFEKWKTIYLTAELADILFSHKYFLHNPAPWFITA